MKSRWGAALIAVLVLGIGFVAVSCKKKSNPAGPGTTADVTITITGISGASSFSPSPTTVTVGQTVAWKNSGGTTHTSTADGGAWNTGNITNGSTSAPIMMNTAGTFPYHCNIHPSMTGSLTVNP
jgi:plastocyanin